MKKALLMFVTGPVLTVCLVGALSGSPAMASTPVRASWLAPAPDISAFIPSNYRVTSVMRMDLDGNGDNEEAITAVGVPDKWGYVPTTVVLIAWDTFAKRWTEVFDAAHQASYQASSQFRGVRVLSTPCTALPLRSRSSTTCRAGRRASCTGCRPSLATRRRG